MAVLPRSATRANTSSPGLEASRWRLGFRGSASGVAGHEAVRCSSSLPEPFGTYFGRAGWRKDVRKRSREGHDRCGRALVALGMRGGAREQPSVALGLGLPR